jgi:hypothetical protein
LDKTSADHDMGIGCGEAHAVDLAALRKRLGLRHDPNIAVHEAIETEISN